MPIKNLLTALHDAAKWLLHVALIPAVAVLKATISALTHIEEALEKI